MSSKKRKEHERANELVIAFTVGSIIDTKKAEEVFKEKGTKAYHEILEKHREKNSIFKPGPALGTMMGLRRLNDAIPDDVLKIRFVLVSKIDPNPHIHAVLMDSMRHYFEENKVEMNYNYGFDMISLTGGEDVTPFLKAVDTDLVFTTSQDSAKELFVAGMNSVCVENVDSETNAELYEKRNGDIVLFSDFDGVMGDADSEKVFQKAIVEKVEPIGAFLDHESSLKDIPMELGPLGRTIQKLSRAVKYQKQIQMKSGQKQDIEVKIVVVTARSGQAMDRFFNTLSYHNIEISQAHMLQGTNKNNILSILGKMNHGKTLLFFDDSKTHYTRSLQLKDIVSVWVPNDENTPLEEEQETENVEKIDKASNKKQKMLRK
jgi:hypothetical protein